MTALPRTDNRGFTLIAVLVLMGSALLVGTSLLFMAQAEMAGSAGTAGAAQSRALAWSGVQVVMSDLNDQRQQILDGETPIVDDEYVIYELDAAILACGLGVRVIAGEIDRRTLEIAYTVPGGAHRVWLAKLGASFLILLAAEALLAIATFVFLTSFPWSTLYGALQPAVFFLVLAMGLGALFKSEAAGGMVCAGVLTLALMTTVLRISPFFNIELSTDLDAVERVARLVQNRIGYVILTLAVMLLTFGRAEQRERLLSG